jgi:RHS repeat-associated protein
MCAQVLDTPREFASSGVNCVSEPTHYNYFRSYDPLTGRYRQADPIDLQGGWNKFVYVGGNPLSNTDPQGLATVCQWVGLVYVCQSTPPIIDPFEGPMQHAVPKPSSSGYPKAANDENYGGCPPDCNELRKQLDKTYKAVNIVIINPAIPLPIRLGLQLDLARQIKAFVAQCGPYTPPMPPKEPPIDKIHDFYSR